MQLTTWEPFTNVDRFFEDFSLMPFPQNGWGTPLDLYEEKGNLIAKMNVPNIKLEDINVVIEGDTLRITGSHEEEKEKTTKRYYRKEIRQGAFERLTRLPKSVDRTKIDATYKGGVLEVTMPIIERENEAPIKIHVTK